jgi:large subunit ribosomal protein L22
MEARAIAKTVRISPSKVRLVTRLISGRQVPEALRVLQFSSKKAARLVEKVLRSAVANAAVKGAVQTEELKVKAATADEGPQMKRYRPAPRGRALRIIKRTSHITVTVADE